MDPKEVASALGADPLGTFPEVVSKLSAEQRRECAEHFKIAPSTVDRWAEGSTEPHPLLQKRVVEWTMRRLAS